ncbi:MAG TPA: MBL fold metallo-hydrolase, partial [Allosphingosinicella sp.]
MEEEVRASAGSVQSGVSGAQRVAPAPDISLTDSEPTSHRGLTYPWGHRAPEQGELIEIVPGVGWARLPVPGSLKHINVWALDDGVGVALVDTGLNLPVAREAWDALFEGPLAGRAVTRIICTHFHPDHIGLAGWLCERFGVRLWMTRGEWLFARMLTLDVRDAPPPEASAAQRAAGWSEERIAGEQAKGWGRFASMVSPVPVSIVRMQDGDVMAIG